MSEEEFDKLVEDRCEKIKQTLINKGREYRRNNNPLWNFEQGARMFNRHTTDILDGFMAKHWISYRDILDDIREGRCINEDVLEEKLGDILVYLVLQEACIKDKYLAPNF